MIIQSQFKPAWWLRNAHAQTIFSTLYRPVALSIDKLEKLSLPDGDFVELAWSCGGLPADAPLIIILHGLGGGVRSSYVPRFMRAFNQQGWRAVLMHFRGAGSEQNKLPRAYHSGDTADFNFFLNQLGTIEPHTLKAAVGVSLGGNVLLKCLGEGPHASKLNTAVAVSVPFLLNNAADRMNQGFSRIYQRHMLGELKEYFAQKAKYFENPPEAFKKAAEGTCFWTFDHWVTAPLHGFSSANEYYRKCSSRQFLRTIKTPTLIIHSEDDPFMTKEVLPTQDELAESVTLELSSKGGHVGFISSSVFGYPIYWLEQRISEYIASQFIALKLPT